MCWSRLILDAAAVAAAAAVRAMIAETVVEVVAILTYSLRH